jgi:hypothetical protein
VARHDRVAAAKIVEQNTNALSDGLLFRQANGGEHLPEFLQLASELNDVALLRAASAIDVERAREFWPQRMRGGEDERNSVGAILELVERAGGRSAELAAEIRQGSGK